MDIKNLKSKIENNKWDNDFMVWIIEDESSEIITNQYINLICKNNNLTLKYIESINDIPDESFISDDNLYVIKIDKWESNDTHSNCIVICNKTKDKLAIKIPKLSDWQIIDFVVNKVSGIEKSELESLLSIYDGNYFRFINDIDKISIFDRSQQKLILNQMIDDGHFSTLTNYKVWDLSNAILKKDKRLIKEVLKMIDYIDAEPLGVAKILYNNFKTVLSVQINPRVTADELGISDKQLFVIKKYNCGFYTNEQLIKILKMLTNIESLFKYEELPLNYLVDYMICKIMGV